MSKSVAALDRIATFIVALGLIFLGVWSILFYLNNPYAVELSEYRNSRIWLSATQQPWFNGLLAGIVVAGVVLGLWLIIANLRRRRIRTIRSESASANTGSISFNVAQIASATAAQLQNSPKVDKVSHLVAFDRGRPSMEFTILAAADANVRSLRAQCAQAERDIRDAIGDAEIDTSYRIELGKIDRTPELVRTVN